MTARQTATADPMKLSVHTTMQNMDTHTGAPWTGRGVDGETVGGEGILNPKPSKPPDGLSPQW